MSTTPRLDWYDVTNVGDGITIIREVMRVEDVKSFLVGGERDIAVLGTGMGVRDFRGLVSQLSENQPSVLHSHAHWDHIGDSHCFGCFDFLIETGRHGGMWMRYHRPSGTVEAFPQLRVISSDVRTG